MFFLNICYSFIIFNVDKINVFSLFFMKLNYLFYLREFNII